MSEFTDLPKSIQKLVSVYEQPLPNLAALPGVPRIKLNEVISKLAYAYEKVRNSIEFGEEHLLRRNAIERILRRRLMVENRHLVDARLLINELIRARYLPNDSLPATLVVIVQNYIDRYLSLLEHLKLRRTDPDDRRLMRWLISVASAEVEERLQPSTREDALVEVMYGTIRNNLVLPEDIPQGQEQDVLVYLAIHRALLKSDDATLRYHLFKWAYPNWEHPDHEITEEVRQNFPKLVATIEERINHPLTERLLVICRRYTIPFRVIADIFQGHTAEIRSVLVDHSACNTAASKAMDARLKSSGARLRRTTVRSIIYVFITKMMLALAIEYPYELIFVKSGMLLSLYVNSIFHPIFMAFIGLSARVPGKDNTAMVVQAVQEILNPQQPRQIFGKRLRPRPRSMARKVILNFFYLVTFVITFGLMVWGLTKLDFSWLSIVIFLFFLSAISFFGMRIRQVVQELTILDRRENLFLLLLSFFSLPILRVGQWLSKKVPKINLIIFILDFIIEAPFKIFVEAVEEWFSFLKEKREEIS